MSDTVTGGMLFILVCWIMLSPSRFFHRISTHLTYLDLHLHLILDRRVERGSWTQRSFLLESIPPYILYRIPSKRGEVLSKSNIY